MNKKEFKAALKDNGLTQKQFARETGYSQQGIAKWVKHDAVPIWVEQWFAGYNTTTEDFVRVLKEIEIQLLEISGRITVIDGSDPTDRELLAMTNAAAVTTIHGVRNIYRSLENHPPVGVSNEAIHRRTSS